MAICTPAPEQFVAAKQNDVQMQSGGLIQQHNVVHIISATDSLCAETMQALTSCRHFELTSYTLAMILAMLLALLAV